MGRQLVVCLDGTGNRFSDCPTNVIRVLRSLPADPASTLAYYDQGVGTFGLKETLFEWQKLPSRICGLAFGWGLRRIVEGAYRFLAQNWQPGDEIFVFGFSRGAFAARALAAMVHAIGLVPAHQAHLFDYAWAMLLARKKPDNAPDFALQERFRDTFGRRVRIRLLGLFDTVKSVGWVYDPVVIPYTIDNPSVDAVRHAVSIDERRCFFRQHRWKPRCAPQTNNREVWFAGVHSDVGGGYAPGEAQLALLSLRWMLGEAAEQGLRLDLARAGAELEPADGVRAAALGTIHDSMTAPWKLAEWAPQRLWRGPGRGRRWTIGAMPPFGTPRARKIPPSATIHHSVRARLDAGVGYRLPNTPRRLHVAADAPLGAPAATGQARAA
ncbi:phospholipase effector Tle1 domain-containing protein [Massilia sp.]|uniref:DUF2235 domain-containing protein n=1 Tax=Massilia sp. TaxID=1882437 RepID=UPI0028AAE17E|nr:DUF2235 domain-containing protein [Massilia sp.]